MGPKYNAATSLEELGSTKTYRRSKRASNVAESQSAKSGPDSQTGAVGCCDGKGKKSLEELESTITYRRSKFASKRVKVPNLAQI